MNIRNFSSLLTFITFVLCHPSLAQSIVDLESKRVLIENSAILENIQRQETTQDTNHLTTKQYCVEL